MPVRIYEISKKLGLENAQVLTRAKELGIQAKVASSQIDKITAEYLENQLCDHPPASTAHTPEPVPVQVPIIQPTSQSERPPGITLQTRDPVVQGLLERILTGEEPFLIEVSRQGQPPLRAHLVTQTPRIVPAPEPKPKQEAAIPIRADLDDRTKYLFKAAYYNARCVSKDEWINMAEYGNALKRQDPTFQPQDFGERTLGGLVRRMMDDFDIKSDGNAPPVYYIRLKAQPVASPQPASPPPPLPQPGAPKHHATGKVHNLKLGFGFIAPDDGGDNLFFHTTEVTGSTIFDLRPGDPVEYEAGVNERGPCAWKVKRLGAGSSEN